MTLITTADATGMLEMAIESDEQVAFAMHSLKANVTIGINFHFPPSYSLPGIPEIPENPEDY